jgi:ubiquinone/menaquinone biosynthesis C-methylase UbiE
VGLYEQHILPRLIDVVCGDRSFDRWRAEASEGLSGTVLEIGFGSGLNLAHYPGQVERVLAVEPSTVARKRAATRMRTAPVQVDFIGLDGESIPTEDDSVDAALCTFTLCTIPDVDRALAEIRRVVRPGGEFRFLEHGLAPDAGVARWQYRLDGIEQRLAGGCHLTRDPLELISRAGMDVTSSRSAFARGPRPWTYLTVGRAVA